MKKYYTSKMQLVGEEDFPAYSSFTKEGAWEMVYLAADVDARIAERDRRIAVLEVALSEAMGWNRRWHENII